MVRWSRTIVRTVLDAPLSGWSRGYVYSEAIHALGPLRSHGPAIMEERRKKILDSEIKLAQCSRCSSYVWACQVSGSRTVVDISPLGDLGLIMGAVQQLRQVYEVIYRVGKPHHLRWLGGPGTTWEPNGRILVASHGCGAGPLDAVPVEIPQEGPQTPVCDLWRAQGWEPPATCPRIGADERTGLLFGNIKAPLSCGTCDKPPFDQGATCNAAAQSVDQTSTPATQRRFTAQPSAATGQQTGAGGSSAAPHASSKPNTPQANARPFHAKLATLRRFNCDTCKKLIKTGDSFIAIEFHTYVWANHDYDCLAPDEDPFESEYDAKWGEKCRTIGWDTARDLANRDKKLVTKPIVDLELPE